MSRRGKQSFGWPGQKNGQKRLLLTPASEPVWAVAQTVPLWPGRARGPSCSWALGRHKLEVALAISSVVALLTVQPSPMINYFGGGKARRVTGGQDGGGDVQVVVLEG